MTLFNTNFSFSARPKTPNNQRPLTGGTEQLSPSARQSPPQRRSSFRSFRMSFRTAPTAPDLPVDDASAASDKLGTPSVAPDPPQLPELDGTDIRLMPSPLPRFSFSAPEEDLQHRIDHDDSGSDFDNSSFDGDSIIEEGLVIASATPVKMAALGRTLSRAREISVVVGSSIHVRPSAPHQDQKRPSPLTLTPSLKSLPRTPECDAVNAMQMRRTTPTPPSLTVTAHHCRGHSEVADGVGLQLLLDSLSESSENSKRLSTTSVASFSTSASMPSPIFSMPEIVGAASERSSIDTYDSYLLWNRKGSHVSYTSTIPTLVSNSSVCGSPVGVNKQPLIPPRLSSRGSFLFSNSDSDGDEEEAPPVSSVPPQQASRRFSATSAFFCRGRKLDSIPATLRTAGCSIGLSSISDRGGPIEDDLTEDFSHYPSIDELKKQISWLAAQRTATYSSDDDRDGDRDASDEDSYHRHLSLISSVACESRNVSAASASSFRFPPASPIGSGVKWTPPVRKRRTRRRTASSECLISDVLDNLEHAGEKREKNSVPLGGTTPWDCDIFGTFTAAELGVRGI